MGKAKVSLAERDGNTAGALHVAWHRLITHSRGWGRFLWVSQDRGQVFKLIYKGEILTGGRASCIPEEQPRFSPNISSCTSRQTGQQPEEKGQMAQTSSQNELPVFTQVEYSYLFSSYRLQGTQKPLKPGLRNNESERTTSRGAQDQYLLWRVGENRRTPSVENRRENGVCQHPLMVNSNCLLRGPTIPC